MTENSPGASCFSMANEILGRGLEQANCSLRAWKSYLARKAVTSAWAKGDEGLLTVLVRAQEPTEQETRQLGGALEAAVLLRDAMSTALEGAVRAGIAVLPDSEGIDLDLPLLLGGDEFEKLMRTEPWWALRPEQVSFLRTLQGNALGGQPYTPVHHLYALSGAAGSSPRLTILATRATAPQVLVSGALVEAEATLDVGLLDFGGEIGVGSAEVAGQTSEIIVRPGVGLELAYTTADAGNLVGHGLGRVLPGLLDLASVFVEFMESSADRGMLARSWLPPLQEDSYWHTATEVDPNLREDILRELAQAETNIGTLENGEGDMLLVRLDGEELQVREVFPEQPLPGGDERGHEVEAVALQAAAEWGLPDFVFWPKTVSKGAATREIGDGTIISGGKGVAVQMKSRDQPSSSIDRERRWVVKQARRALDQAAGTIRTALGASALSLTNLRGREVEINGSEVEWLPVIIIDHAEVPPGLELQDPDGRPAVYLTRRDWEFLWDQLRSASAVVDYLHRVALGPECTLGFESSRYLSLAQADAAVSPLATESAAPADVVHYSYPLLPIDSPAASDVHGHRVFRTILDDIATAPLQSGEEQRVRMLGAIDRVPVGHRAELGRLLIRQLASQAASATGIREFHRTFLLDEDSVHLAFSVLPTSSGFHCEMHKQWLFLRREQLIENGLTPPRYALTVGVMLSPRFDDARPWDTTMLATDSAPPLLDADHRASLEQFWPPLKTDRQAR